VRIGKEKPPINLPLPTNPESVPQEGTPEPALAPETVPQTPVPNERREPKEVPA
jgi:hypothetical protein